MCSSSWPGSARSPRASPASVGCIRNCVKIRSAESAEPTPKNRPRPPLRQSGNGCALRRDLQHLPQRHHQPGLRPGRGRPGRRAIRPINGDRSCRSLRSRPLSGPSPLPQRLSQNPNLGFARLQSAWPALPSIGICWVNMPHSGALSTPISLALGPQSEF